MSKKLTHTPLLSELISIVASLMRQLIFKYGDGWSVRLLMHYIRFTEIVSTLSRQLTNALGSGGSISWLFYCMTMVDVSPDKTILHTVCAKCSSKIHLV